MKLLFQISRSHLHDAPIRLLEDVLSTHLQATVTRLRLHCVQLRAECLHLVNEVAAGAGRAGRREGEVRGEAWNISGGGGDNRGRGLSI